MIPMREATMTAQQAADHVYDMAGDRQTFRDWFAAHWPEPGAFDVDAIAREVLQLVGYHVTADTTHAIAAIIRRHLPVVVEVTGEDYLAAWYSAKSSPSGTLADRIADAINARLRDRAGTDDARRLTDAQAEDRMLKALGYKPAVVRESDYMTNAELAAAMQAAVEGSSTDAAFYCKANYVELAKIQQKRAAIAVLPTLPSEVTP